MDAASKFRIRQLDVSSVVNGVTPRCRATLAESVGSPFEPGQRHQQNKIVAPDPTGLFCPKPAPQRSRPNDLDYASRGC